MSPSERRARVATLTAVLAASAVSALWGLTARDLTGDEQALGEHIAGVLSHCYMPGSPADFSARLPLFGVLRALCMKAMPEAVALARRLPAALCVIGCAAAHWWLFARERRWGAALFAGLALALHPLASFYAHDSSNYALSPLGTVFVIAGLADLRAGREAGARWLGVGLILGTFTDFFFLFVLSSAAGLTWWVTRGSIGLRRAGLRAWAVLLAVQALPAIVLIRHLTRFPAEDFVAPHADAADVRLDPLEGLADHASRITSSFFEGYHLAGEADPVLFLVALVLAGVGVVRGLRAAPPEHVGAGLLVAALGQMLLVGFVFTAVTGRFAPLAVRSHMVLLSPLVVVWAAAVGEPGRGRTLATVGAVALLGALGVRTGHQLAHPAATRQPVADRIVDEWQEGDELVSLFSLHHHLPAGFPGRSDVDPCLPDDAEPRRLWLVGDPGSTWPDTITRCGGGEPLLSTGWALRSMEHRPLPFYEWDSGSFLVGTALYLFERGSPAAAHWPTTTLAAPDAPAGHEVSVRWRVPEGDDDDGTILPLAAAMELPAPPPGAEALELALRGPDGVARDWLVLAPAAPGSVRLTTGRAAGPVVWTDAPSLTASVLGDGSVVSAARRALALLAAISAGVGLALGLRRTP